MMVENEWSADVRRIAFLPLRKATMNRIENQQLDTIGWNKLNKCQPIVKKQVPSLHILNDENLTLWGWLPP
jgi:hypothetical protein